MINGLIRKEGDMGCMWRGKPTLLWGCSEVAICNPRREASEETTPTNTLIFHFQPPELWENKFLLFSTFSLWYFVMAAWEKKCTSSYSFNQVWHFSFLLKSEREERRGMEGRRGDRREGSKEEDRRKHGRMVHGSNAEDMSQYYSLRTKGEK